MGTRGALGFRLNNKDYVTYNHMDSYPDWLGKCIAEWALSVQDWDDVKAKVSALIPVDDRKKPGAHHLLALQEFHDPTVDGGKSWYSLLRETQGDPAAILRAGHYIPRHDFLKDSLWCEYAYIINLDTMEIEGYRGFQKKKHRRGRYGLMRKLVGDYYPVALTLKHSIEGLNVQNFVNEFESLTEEVL